MIGFHSNLEKTLNTSKERRIGGDKFDMFEDVGELKVADLSLVELELENVVFDEDRNEDALEEREE